MQLKYYIIEDIVGDFNNLFLLKAKSKKEALDKVWSVCGYDQQEPKSVTGYDPHYKTEFRVRALDEYCEYYGSDFMIIR